MGMPRRDLFGECNVDGAPIDVFSAECCVRCINPECTRSARGGKFELRVQTWQDRLFDNPARMRPDDPRYRSIAGQNFLAVDVGPVPNVRGSSGWIDPLAVKEAKRAELVAMAEKAGPLPTTALASAEAVAEPKPKPPSPRHLLLANAPDQSGKTVGPAPAPPAPKPDPWVQKSPPASPGTIISPGATVKFGGGGV